MLETIVTYLIRTRIPGVNRLAALLFPPRREAKRYIVGVGSRSDGVKMQLDTRNHIDWVTFFHGDFEPEISRLIRGNLKAGSVFVDIGANIGCHTLTAAKCVGDAGRVLAFEPNPTIREVLQRNVEINEFTQIVSIFDCALGSAPSRLPLRVPSLNSREGSNMGLASLVALDTPHELVQVEVRRLDDVLPFANVCRCDMIKVDVQGYEAEVLAGMTQTLAKYRPLLVLEWEAWAWQQAGVNFDFFLHFMIEQDYQLYRLLPDGEWDMLQNADNLPGHADLIATHRDNSPR